MRALYSSGRQADALASYHAMRARYADELGIEPGPTLRDLFASILRQEETLNARTNVGSSLPLPTHSLIGREKELEDIYVRVNEVRLLTVTGPGGVGKSHVALEVANMLQKATPQQVAFLDLTRFENSGAFLSGLLDLLSRLGVGAIPVSDKDERQDDCLVLLDNFEHLVISAELRHCFYMAKHHSS